VHRNDLRCNETQLLSSLDLLGHPHDHRVLFAFVRGASLGEVQGKKVFEEAGAKAALQADDQSNRFGERGGQIVFSVDVAVELFGDALLRAPFGFK